MWTPAKVISGQVTLLKARRLRMWTRVLMKLLILLCSLSALSRWLADYVASLFPIYHVVKVFGSYSARGSPIHLTNWAYK